MGTGWEWGTHSSRGIWEGLLKKVVFPGDLEVRVFAQTGEWGISLWRIGHKKREIRVTGLGTTLGEGRSLLDGEPDSDGPF